MLVLTFDSEGFRIGHLMPGVKPEACGLRVELRPADRYILQSTVREQTRDISSPTNDNAHRHSRATDSVQSRHNDRQLCLLATLRVLATNEDERAVTIERAVTGEKHSLPFHRPPSQSLGRR